jgi:hypothetical protein
VLIFNTGAGQKYPESVREELPKLDIANPIRWREM